MQESALSGMEDANRRLVVVRRFDDDDQQQRRDAIAGAAKALASAHGYKGVTVRAIAQAAEVSPVTIYSYFGSKDGILRHLLVNWSLQVVHDLWASAAERSGSQRERVSAGMCRVIGWAAEDLNLLSAGMTALFTNTSGGGGVNGYQPLFVELVRACLGESTWGDDRGAAAILGHVYIACLLDLTAGDTSTREVQAHMHTAVTLLFAQTD